MTEEWISGQPVHLGAGAYSIRSLGEAEASTYARWCSDPVTMRYLNLPRNLSLDAHRRVLHHADNRSRFMLGIFELAQVPIGFCKCTLSVAHKRAHLTTVIGEPSSRNRGIAQTVHPVIHEFLFTALSVEKIVLSAQADNLPALHLLRKHGLVLEAEYKQHERGSDGTYKDVCVFGLLRQDWLEQQPEPGVRPAPRSP